MIDNPFAEPDDGRTMIRPYPDGRRPPVDLAGSPDATVVAPRAHAMPTPVVTEPVDIPAILCNPLVDAAAPLLQLLARLRNTLTPPVADNLRDSAAQEVRRFEQRTRAAGLSADTVRPAHYALCASIDDVVLNTPWGSAGGWDARSLVSSFHHEVRGGERFFELLGAMRKDPQKFLPVLELMYLCLSLGFMGRHRLSPRGPAEIDHLREELYATVASLRARAEPELSPIWCGVSAPYRASRGGVPLWVAASAGLALLGGLFVWTSVSLNGASDVVYERMLQAPPVTNPTIARIAPPQAPKPAPATESSPLERLGAFLKPEVDARLVEIVGTEGTPVVRTRQGGMFGSGSATLADAAAPLLQRIGAALKTETGSVQVIGYTDNAPIRTARFPSNFQLSTARASAAAAVIGRSVGDVGRISSEGRADANPIASNATPEGRAANRRIEVVLLRR